MDDDLDDVVMSLKALNAGDSTEVVMPVVIDAVCLFLKDHRRIADSLSARESRRDQ